APARLSTRNCCPSCAVSPCAIRRAARSWPPPTSAVTIRTGFAGYSCARAETGMKRGVTKKATRAVRHPASFKFAIHRILNDVGGNFITRWPEEVSSHVTRRRQRERRRDLRQLDAESCQAMNGVIGRPDRHLRRTGYVGAHIGRGERGFERNKNGFAQV